MRREGFKTYHSIASKPHFRVDCLPKLLEVLPIVLRKQSLNTAKRSFLTEQRCRLVENQYLSLRIDDSQKMNEMPYRFSVLLSGIFKMG